MIGKGLIHKGWGGLNFTNDGTKTTILGIAGDYLRIGDAATTYPHAILGSLDSEDDLMVTGQLEIRSDVKSSSHINLYAQYGLNVYPRNQNTYRFIADVISNIPCIYGYGAYLSVGDAFTTRHSLNADDDLLVTGELEVCDDLFIGVSSNINRFHDTITLDTGDAETAVGLTPDGVLLSAAIRVSTEIAGLDSADHHIQLGINGTSDKYIDKAQGAAATTISANKKDNYTFNPDDGIEASALVLTVTGGGDNTPSAGAVEVEVIYITSSDLADV